jgi:hypothetical protein
MAYLDGDDYWTSRHKLQWQADLLDRHPDLGLCFHPIYAEYEQEGGRRQPLYPPGRRARYTLEELLQANFIAHASVMYRHIAFTDLPEILKRAPFADAAVHVMHAQQGAIGYVDEVLAVRRMTGQGMQTSLKEVVRYERSLQLLELLDEMLEFRYHGTVQATKEFTRFRIFLAQGKRREALLALRRCLQEKPDHLGIRWMGWRNIVGELLFLGRYARLKQRLIAVRPVHGHRARRERK